MKDKIEQLIKEYLSDIDLWTSKMDEPDYDTHYFQGRIRSYRECISDLEQLEQMVEAFNPKEDGK